jgi:hypothetical protein
MCQRQNFADQVIASHPETCNPKVKIRDIF